MKDIVYFDNAATTYPKPECVYEAINSASRSLAFNVGRGQYEVASKGSKIIDDTRNKILDLFECRNTDKQVIFTHSATEALNFVLNGIVDETTKNIYITHFEHNAILRTLHKLQNEYGFSLHYITPNENFEYEVDDIKEMFLINQPDLIILNHGSNVFGNICPIQDIVSLSKKYKSKTVIDMSQTAGLVKTKITSDFDFVIFAGHKTLYSMFGVAGIICDKDISFSPLIYGGTGVESANREMPERGADRYEAGSHNIVAIASLNAALDWICDITLEEIYKVEQSNRYRLFDLLSSFNNIKVLSPRDNGIGVISCIFDDYPSDSIGMVLAENNICVRTGLHCAPDAHKFKQTFPSGTVRFSVNYFNSDKDFEELERVLNYIKENS